MFATSSKRRLRSAWALLIVAAMCTAPVTPSQAQPRSTMIHPMDNLQGIEFISGTPQVVPEGPNGEQVMRFEGQATGGSTGRIDARFQARIDLGPRGIDLREYDLLKVEVKADRAAFLLFSTDNYPDAGTQARWYALDALRGPVGGNAQWKTLYLDLDWPEEIKTSSTSSLPYLIISGSIKDTGRAGQGEDRRIWLGAIRAVQKAVDIDWDQREVAYTWNTGSDLVYTYPLTVTNKLNTPITANLSLVPFQVHHASASLSQTQVSLGAGAQTTVQAHIRLPASVASSAAPLYTERFEARAEAEGIADSEVTILRSSDPIHLPVTVPLPEAHLQFPLLPTPNQLPSNILRFNEPLARSLAVAASPSVLIARAMEEGIYNYTEGRGDSSFRKALVSSAYLYTLTGEAQYLDIAAQLLHALPDIWDHHYRQWQSAPNKLISHGIIVRMNEGWHYTLGLGWRLMGTQRLPYQFSYDHNSRGGSMSAILYAFDMLAPALDPAERWRFIEAFLVPAGIQSRNHYIGDGNQQATANSVTLYAGLASRNWPLVAFAHSSEHAYRGIIEWTFTDAGAHIRDTYQTYTLRPLFWTAELLYGRGINVYETYRDRLQLAVDHPAFHDRYFWNWVVSNRLASSHAVGAPSHLVATGTPSGISLGWQDHADNEAGFKIERSLSSSAGFSQIAQTAENVTTYDDPCSPGTTYYYRVRGFNYAHGNADYTAVAQATCATR